MAKLLVVIVNYRTSELTVDCLASLEPEVQTTGDTYVIVIDNASGDNSVPIIREAIKRHGWDWVRLIPLSCNKGFAYGNNVAIRSALDSDDAPDYIYLLNPDVLVRPGVLQELLLFAEAHPDAGVIGTRIENPDGSVRHTAFRFHSVLGEFESTCRIGPVCRLLKRWKNAPPPPEHPSRVQWVSGASMMVRREVFNQVGLLDDQYFMYYEEQDFIYRANRANWQCWYLPSSRIVHLVGQASGVTKSGASKRRPVYWFNARRRFWSKHFSWPSRQAGGLAFLAGLSCWRIYCAITRHPPIDPPKLARDFVRYCVLFRRS